MAAVHADAAVFGYAVYSQGVENALQGDEAKKEEKTSTLICEPCPCAKEDFIVFAEFSEITGPVPLLTIPSKLASYEDIDMNALIMKIMSVDYQANPSGQFAFSLDVQVLQQDVLPGRHAYVHYCTLHDLRARGFVRPLCLAYVSADHKKLHENFNVLRRKFLAKEEDGENLTPEEQRSMSRTQIDQLAHQHTELHHMLLAAEPLQNNEDTEILLDKWWHIIEQSPEEECRKYALRVKQPSVPLASAASVGPPSLREPLRSVPALSPWGTAAMLWHLLGIQQTESVCRLHTSLAMFVSETTEENQRSECPEEALADPEFLQLLLSISLSFHWPNSDTSPTPSSLPIEVLSPVSLEYMEANLVASGNEASSSYHSAPESLSELMTAFRPEDDLTLEKRTLSQESFLDVPSDSDSCDEPPEEEDGTVLDVWACCPWNADLPVATNVSGRRLLRFFQRYNRAAQHIVYSLLMGRTVVLAAGETSRVKVRGLLVSLSALVPISPPSILWWHRGILVSSHVSSYQLIGICVPERLSVHDMISPRDKGAVYFIQFVEFISGGGGGGGDKIKYMDLIIKSSANEPSVLISAFILQNLVTILEVTAGCLWGPAYSGQLLNSLDTIPPAVTSDHTLLLLLQSIGCVLTEKLFILKVCPASVADTLFKLGLTGCDADILKHLMHVGLGTLSLKDD
ncbi:Uncharacterized protein GBIM_19894 [Gryllus bimaculatus]|nr:Uncharacterized protein GBIM_19894 [Gryllus bimaculatus]